MHVFIDDSNTFSKNGFMCLAGLMADDESWEVFCERWHTLLNKFNLDIMHTSDFLAGQGEYRDINLSYEDRIDILREFLDVIREETQCGVFCAIHAHEYRDVLSHTKKKLKAEEFLFRRIMRRSFDYMIETKSVESIGVWLDDSNVTSSRFLSIWTSTKKNWQFSRTMLASIAFGDDRALPQLQAADVLANVLVRCHASGMDAWHGKSPFSRLFINPETRAIATHIRGEIWEPQDVKKLEGAILEMAKPT